MRGNRRDQPADGARSRPIRVLVAEDSPTARALLVATLESDPRIQVVDVARDGVEAVEKVARLKPDLVTMDIRMPRLGGFEATKRIMEEHPTPIVIVSGSVDHRDVEVSLDAIRKGALSVLPKLPAPTNREYAWRRTRLLDTVTAMSAVRVRSRRPVSEPHIVVPPGVVPGTRPLVDLSRVRAVALAASTGGPGAVRSLLKAMGKDISVPLFLVQHISPGFCTGFVRWLDGMGFCPVRRAEDGVRAKAGVLYVAPDDRHLGVSRGGRIVLSDAPPRSGFRPAATHLFESMARAHGRQGLGVVLTGMGSDGLEGVRVLKERGGLVIVQDEESAVVWGMPGVVARAGLADAQVAPAILGSMLKHGLKAGP